MKKSEDKLIIKFLTELKEDAFRSGNELLTHVIPKIQNAKEGELTKMDLIELIKNCQSVCCFHNEVILNELRQVGIKNNTLRWFIKAEHITIELQRLEALNLFKFSKLTYLAGIIFHIQEKVMIEIIEGSGFLEKYNNKTNYNLLRKAFDQFFRRRDYQIENYSTKNIPEIDLKTNEVIEKIELTFGNSAAAKKILMEMSRGNTVHYLNLLDEFEVIKGTRSQSYLELFDLIKLIIKDERFLTEDEYIFKDIYSKGYGTYKISKVKKYIKA